MKTILTLIILALTFACHSTRESTPAPNAEPVSGEWRLSRLNDRDVVATPLPLIKITPSGEVSGRGGVNSYSATLDPGLLQRRQFKMSTIISTEMAGSPEANRLEREFFAALQSAARYQTADGQLTLLDSAGKALATFSRSSAP
jgi:heat shock protein HslJ